MLGSFLRNVVYATSLVIVALLAIDTLGVKITRCWPCSARPVWR